MTFPPQLGLLLEPPHEMAHVRPEHMPGHAGIAQTEAGGIEHIPPDALELLLVEAAVEVVPLPPVASRLEMPEST